MRQWVKFKILSDFLPTPTFPLANDELWEFVNHFVSKEQDGHIQQSIQDFNERVDEGHEIALGTLGGGQSGDCRCTEVYHTNRALWQHGCHFCASEKKCGFWVMEMKCILIPFGACPKTPGKKTVRKYPITGPITIFTKGPHISRHNRDRHLLSSLVHTYLPNWQPCRVIQTSPWQRHVGSQPPTKNPAEDAIKRINTILLDLCKDVWM